MPQLERINSSGSATSPLPPLNGFITPDLNAGTDDAEINARYQQLIQALPAAIYTCDANGFILSYNQTAVELWGREPEIGKELWCGSWKIYTTDGAPMPLDECPMAIALKEGREVRDHEIIVERPDGLKRHIMPHPKPFFNASGKVTGAVNMLVDITDRKIIEERNGHFAAMVQSSDDAIISKTLDGIITSWNNSAERIFGYTAQEMIGAHITRIIPPDRLDEESKILNRLKRGERIDHFETKRMAKDGRLLDISLSISPLKNSKGQVIGASKIARDITAQKIAEQQIRENEERLRESEDRLRLAVEVAELGMWDLDLRTGLITTSPEHRKIIGHSKTELWSKALFMEMIYPADLSRVELAFQTALKTGKISYETRIIRKDRSERWIRVNGTTIYDKKHVPVRILGTVLDITDQKKAKEELEKMVLARTSELLISNEELEKSNHELEQFAYIASHDLQEPLRKIQTFADMVKDHLHDSEMAEKYFDKINASAKRMSKLINDVLNYSRLTKTGEQFVTTDLNKVLKDVLSDFELLIEQKQAVITYTDLPVIKGIPLQLHQLFGNLMSNSLKFSETTPHITITSKILTPEEVHDYARLNEDKKYVQLVFEDKGIGFEQQYAEQIFIIFQRLNNQRTYSGTGIGLALCKKIVDHHDGIITAKSELEQGATFTIILPVDH
jgi:PAS domain S-box-containing protein